MLILVTSLMRGRKLNRNSSQGSKTWSISVTHLNTETSHRNEMLFGLLLRVTEETNRTRSVKHNSILHTM